MYLKKVLCKNISIGNWSGSTWNSGEKLDADWFKKRNHEKQFQVENCNVLPYKDLGGCHLYKNYPISMSDPTIKWQFIKPFNNCSQFHFPVDIQVEGDFLRLQVTGMMKLCKWLLLVGKQ